MWRLSELTRRANSTSVSRGFGGNFGFQLLAQLEALLGVPNHAFSLRKSLSAVWCYPAPTVGFAGDTSRPLWDSSSGCHCWSAFKGENSWDIPRIKKQLWNDLTLYSHSSHQRLLPSFGGKWCLTPTALSSRKMCCQTQFLHPPGIGIPSSLRYACTSLGQLGCLGINMEPVVTWIGLGPSFLKRNAFSFSQWFHSPPNSTTLQRWP